MSIPDLLLQHFLSWQEAEGKRLPAKQFADFIGIGEKSFNLIFNGKRKPTKEQTYLLVQALGDERFYELTGHTKPSDPLRLYVDKHWKKLDIKGKKEIAEIIRKYVKENPPSE